MSAPETLDVLIKSLTRRIPDSSRDAALTIDDLVDISGFSRNTVIAAIESLEQRGLVTVAHRGGGYHRPNLYRLRLRLLGSPHPSHRWVGDAGDARRRCARCRAWSDSVLGQASCFKKQPPRGGAA